MWSRYITINFPQMVLTHWGRVTHICVGNLTTIGSDNDLSPGRRQAVNWANVGILLIGPLGTNFNEMLIEIHTFSFKKIHLKISSGKWRPFCLGLNMLRVTPLFARKAICWMPNVCPKHSLSTTLSFVTCCVILCFYYLIKLSRKCRIWD